MHAYVDVMSISLCLVQAVVITVVRVESWIVSPLSCSVHDAKHRTAPSAD
jgi:hypothetical protein